jgi:hypothetical protein
MKTVDQLETASPFEDEGLTIRFVRILVESGSNGRRFAFEHAVVAEFAVKTCLFDAPTFPLA